MGSVRAFAARVTALMTDVPDPPNFSCFHEAFRHDAGSRHRRRAIFAPASIPPTMPAGRERHQGCSIRRSTSACRMGSPLVSANFVIPYPPGFPDHGSRARC